MLTPHCLKIAAISLIALQSWLVVYTCAAARLGGTSNHRNAARFNQKGRTQWGDYPFVTSILLRGRSQSAEEHCPCASRRVRGEGILRMEVSAVDNRRSKLPFEFHAHGFTRNLHQRGSLFQLGTRSSKNYVEHGRAS